METDYDNTHSGALCMFVVNMFHFISIANHFQATAMSLLNYQIHLLILSLLPLLITPDHVSINPPLIYPLNCSNHMIQTCKSHQYHISRGLQVEKIASFYSVNSTDIKPITYRSKQDYLVSVPCTCKDVNGTLGYFYDTLYQVQSGDTFADLTSQIYSGQAWEVGGEESILAGEVITVHLVCGCLEVKSQEVVTYTVQEHDTLSNIADTFSANLREIESLNGRLAQNPSFIDVGWVLFVPMGNRGIQAPKKGKTQNWTIIGVVISAVMLFILSTLVIVFVRKRNSKKKEDTQTVSKNQSSKKISLLNQFQKRDIEDVTMVESERPVLYSVEEIEKATNNFDESKKIGEGGYGSVYYGILGEQEVAIKKMKDSRSKEFFAELKVLCKIHHINVVELLGYASGDNHLYLVYEFVRNGSLNEHLHSPVLKGHQPLTWTERARIALDTARGIEYIHDHTKARYVHRDIKTSNILLDQGLSAKVADFGLARLVERSVEEDCIATSLVGTPGYIPPESVRELQMTSKTDVYAFGVVLAELVTGQRALSRDNQEPHRMKTLASTMHSLFRDSSKTSLEAANIDSKLEGNYPMEEVYKMAETSWRCLNEEAANRPEMREIVQTLSHVLMSSIEWEALLGGNDQVFSGLLVGR